VRALRRILPALLAALLLAAALATDPARLVGGPAEGGIMGTAIERNREILTRAAASFAAAKAISATLAVVASAEVTGSIPLIGGVGGSVAPGSALAPVADLVDTFATVMLTIASAAAGTEVAMRAGDAWGLRTLLPAGLALVLASALLGLLPGGGPPRIRTAFRRLGRAMAVAAVALQVLLPLSVLGSARLSATLLEPQWSEATAQLEGLERETRVEPPPPESEDASIFDRLARLKDAIGRNLERVDVAGLLAGFDDLFMQLVALITAFVMRGLVLPVVLLWALMKAVRIVLGAFAERPPGESPRDGPEVGGDGTPPDGRGVVAPQP
jgi:hypothetical protein